VKRLATLLAVLSALALAAAPQPASAEVVNRIVATVDGDPITLVELESFSARYKSTPTGEKAPALDQRALLDELVVEKLMKKQVEAQGLTATKQQVDDYLESIRSRNNLSEEQLREALELRGLDWDEYMEQVKLDIERANLINKEIRARVNVSPEEIQRYYDAHQAEYARAPRVHVRLISLLVAPDASEADREATKTKAGEIRAEAAGGANFAKLAQEHSQGPAADEGGDLGEMNRGEMQPAFDAAAFSLAEGQVSEVIETDTGYHILRVEEQLGESHTPLEDVSDEIRERLYREAMEDRYDRWFKKDLRERHHVEIML
jgi:peptidyl-prolyl cis-trans isomerase SurA